MSTALDHLRVLELGTQVSAPYCGKILADLGADVLKVEPPEGDPSRRRGPFPQGEENPEASALFLYLNTNKRGQVLDLETSADRARLAELVASTDLLLDNHPRHWLESLGLDWKRLQEINPNLVYASITPYGRTGPRADALGDELTLTHAGGLGYLLPTRSRDTSRAPVKLGGYQVGYHGGLVAALAALGALSQKAPPAQLIDISLQEVVLALVAPLVAGARYHHSSYHRVPDRPPAMGRLETSDGYVVLNAFDDHHFAVLRELMGNPDWCSGEEWLSMAYRVHHLMDIAPQIEAWARSQKKADLHRLAGERGIPIGPIDDASEVLANPQFASRDFFQDVEHPVAGRQRYAGWPYKMAASAPTIRRPAPLLGEHDDTVWAKRCLAGGEEGQPENPSGRSVSRPLEGVRVLEFCWVWAGPYAGSLLGALGAEVIKVEGHRRMDLTRRGLAWPLAEPAPSSLPPSQGMAFNSVNMNKRSLTLDLGQPAGVELARRLVEESDVVVDNMRPGALGKLGLGYEDLRKIRPDVIAASSSGRGSTGEECQYLGFAMVHQAIGGGAHISGYPDDHPTHSGGDVDLMNAMALAVSILAALHHRRKSGEGQFIDFSQCEGVSSLLGEVFLGYQMSGVLPERAGNRDHQYAPHGVYRAWGVDRWLAIEVHSSEEFRRLAECIGRPELAEDPRFGTVMARKANEEALDRILEQWTRERDRDWMAAVLQRAGVAAAPSRTAADLYADPHLVARGAFVTVDHPELGPLQLVAPPWSTNEQERPARCAPLLGQDNQSILRDLLGLSPERIAEFAAQDVVLSE